MANDSKTTILDEALLAVLKEKLPQMQVDFVTEALQSIPKLEEQLLAVKKELKSQKDYSDTLWQKSSNLELQLSAFKHREDDLIAREEAVAKTEVEQKTKELEWSKQLLEKDVECQKAIACNLFNITSQVFNSPVFTQSVVGSMSMKNSYGGIDLVPYNQLQTFEQSKSAAHVHDVIPGVNTTTQPKQQ